MSIKHWTDTELPLPSRPEWDPSLPVVSIITPNYNYGHFLETCIRSILLQTYANIEYIIVDGGSTDNTVDLIKQYEADGITHWISEKDNGQTDAINKGFSLSTGEIFTWLNSDDSFANSGVIQEIVSYYQKGNQFIVGEIDMVDVEGNTVESMREHGRSIPVTYADYLRYWKVPPLPQPSVFVSRKIAATAFPLSTELYTIMDYQYFLRCLKENPKSIWVSSVWVKFLLHEWNKTSEQGQVGQNTDAEYDRVFEEESCFLPTKERKHYLKELRTYHSLRALMRKAESDTMATISEFVNSILRHPGLFTTVLYWKLLTKKLVGKSIYKKLKIV